MRTTNRVGWRLIAFLLAGGLAWAMAAPSHAQEPAKENAAQEPAQDKDAEEDPFVIPDGTAGELLAFIDKARRIPAKDRSVAAAHMVKMYGAISTAADKILAMPDLAVEQETEALKAKFNALAMLSRSQPDAREQMIVLANKYATDARLEIAALAGAQLLQAKSAQLATSTPEQALELADMVLAYLEKVGVNPASYAVAAGVGRTLGSSEHMEVGAELYESMAAMFETADNEDLRKRASSMLGAARRLRLPGNSMELTGVTGDGEAFDWASYRGKVVLVDFWASWCGPCIAELPSMKKNLALYGDKGFTIVGINMDSTRAAYEKCLEEKEISWVNLVCEEEGKTGWYVPMATHYGVSAIPTAILVDKDGKVVSVRARGRVLDELLAVLLGPAEESKEAEDAK